MVVNISQVNDFLHCPRYWWWRYVARRGHDAPALEPDDPLDLGLLWHRVAAGEEALPLEAPSWMVKAHEALLAWERAHPDVLTMGNELKLEAPFGHHTLMGRLDRLVIWGGKAWHFQHKTIDPSKPLHVYKRFIARSFHEHAYAYLVCSTAGIDQTAYGGTILACARKLSDRKLLTDNPFSVEYLPLENHRERLDDLVKVVDIMAARLPRAEPSFATASAWSLTQPLHRTSGYIPPQNPNACAGPYGNKLCQYIDACDGRSPIEAYPELNPLERYTPR